jgi:hypothetical protein
MASEVEICNLGLRHLAVKRIQSISPPDNSQAARDCALFYPINKNVVLRDHEWNFAHKRKTMTAFTIPTDYLGKYSYAYLLPADCLKPRRVYAPSGTTDEPFEIMRTPTLEKVIFTDVAEAILSYTMKVTDASWFDDEFVNALGLLMGSTLAIPLTKSKKAADVLTKQYYLALPQAEVSNKKEDKPEDVSVDPWISSRTAY